MTLNAAHSPSHDPSGAPPTGRTGHDEGRAQVAASAERGHGVDRGLDALAPRDPLRKVVRVDQASATHHAGMLEGVL